MSVEPRTSFAAHSDTPVAPAVAHDGATLAANARGPVDPVIPPVKEAARALSGDEASRYSLSSRKKGDRSDETSQMRWSDIFGL